jgi:hypothetical protein
MDENLTESGIDRTALAQCATNLLINGLGPNVQIERDGGSRPLFLAAFQYLMGAFDDATESPQSD